MHLSIRQRVALELDRRLWRKRVAEHPLRQLFWECTLRCNLRCRHCGSDCKMVAQTPDMPAEDFLRVIDSLTPHVDPHRVMIIISGGEPLMRDDLEAVGTALMERGYPWGIVTNGMLLTEERLRGLIAAGMRSAAVSLDGLADDHCWMRGHDLSFDRATRAIRLLARTEGLAWDVLTCVNRRNIDSLPAIRDLVVSLGIRRWRLTAVFPSGRAREDEEMQLTNAQFRHLLDFIRETRRSPLASDFALTGGQQGLDCTYACEGFLGSYEGEVRSRLYHCHAGVSVASVLIDGTISGCTSIRGKYGQGNIYRDDLWDVWQNGFEAFRNRAWMRHGACADCKAWRYCEGGGMHLRDDAGQLTKCHLACIEGE